MRSGMGGRGRCDVRGVRCWELLVELSKGGGELGAQGLELRFQDADLGEEGVGWWGWKCGR